jgi:hypothetical protein
VPSLFIRSPPDLGHDQFDQRPQVLGVDSHIHGIIRRSRHTRDTGINTLPQSRVKRDFLAAGRLFSAQIAVDPIPIESDAA